MSDWNEFLLAQGAGSDAAGEADFPFAEFDPDKNWLMPLSHQGLLSIHGPDAVKFLQGQVTCDVRELSNNQTRLGAQCNIKGRMLLCFRAIQTDAEQIFLRINNELIQNGLASLGKYIVFSKAKLTDATANYRYVGIAGPAAINIVKEVFGIEISSDNNWQQAGKNIIIRINNERFECWLDSETAKSSWEKLAMQAVPGSRNIWQLLNIQAGLGDINADTYETLTPQAINFQLVDGISFRKGCYTGQEIVARLHYRGTLKRHMYRFEFHLANANLPKPGSEIKNADGKNVGEIILSAKKSGLYGELLASVMDDERIDIYLPDYPQKLEPLALPYAIPTPNEAD